MMRTPQSILLSGLIVAAFSIPGTSQGRYSLDEVLDRMIEGGRELETLEAHVDRDTVTVIVDDHSLDSGEIFFISRGDASEIRMNLTEPAPRALLVADGKARVYNPRTNQVQEVDLSERDDITQYIVVGFGPANASLKDIYEASLIGEDDLDGVATSVIDLRPKSAELLRNFSNVRLWVDQERWIPIQQRLDQPGGNYQVVRYSQIKINGGLSDSIFELDLPDDVQIFR
jgi:outer membrane lipoprotein-sorting protein